MDKAKTCFRPRICPAAVMISVAVVAAVAALIVLDGQRTVTPWVRALRSDLPVVEVIVKFVDAQGQALTSLSSPLADHSRAPRADAHCPAWLGGDAAAANWSMPRPADCPRIATWLVHRQPIAVSASVQDGHAVWEWLTHNPHVQALLHSEAGRGAFEAATQTLNLKAEDFALSGLQGEFMQVLLREALMAHGQLHYDLAHGAQGWVLSFQREDAPFAARAVPILVAALAHGAYRVAALNQPVLEMRIGAHTLLLAEYDGRIYVGLNLAALLNVLDSSDAPSSPLPAAPLVVSVRSSAFADAWLTEWLGPDAQWIAAFNLNNDGLGVLEAPSGPYARRLAAQFNHAVLSAIPHDAFAALAGSVQLTTSSASSGGAALLWDVDAAHPQGAVGLVLSAPDTLRAFDPATPQARCHDDQLWLLASTPALLARMQSACNQHSASVQAWRGGALQPYLTASQVFLFANPNAALRAWLPQAAPLDLPIWAYLGNLDKTARLNLSGVSVPAGEI